MAFDTAAILLAWVAIVLLAFVMSGLVRQIHQLSGGATAARGAGPVGSVGPRRGSRLSLEHLGGPASRPLLLLFVTSGCPACDRAIEWLDTHEWSGPREVRVVSNDASAPPRAGTATTLTAPTDVFADNAIVVTPFAVRADHDGHVEESRPLRDVSDLEGLLEWRAKEPA